MKILVWLKRLCAIFAIIFIFINWKVGIILFILGIILHAIPEGPKHLLNTLTGILIASGVFYFLINWKIAILLVISGFAISRFNLWADKVNYNYYNKNEN